MPYPDVRQIPDDARTESELAERDMRLEERIKEAMARADDDAEEK
jgi:hypothetical protein